jgi:pyrroline-5-carboxylate reductase
MESSENSLGILGAGRLGQAIAKVWFRRTGEMPLVWSRSGQHGSGSAVPRVPEGAWVNDWTTVLQARSVIVAIPGRVLLELAEGSEQALTYDGVIFSAAASLSQESLQRVFPNATAICIAPFLIDSTNSIPTLVLRPSQLGDFKWETAKTELRSLGDVDVVEDEDLFSQLSLLGAPWPVIVLAAIQAACGIGIKGLEDEAAIGIGQHVFFRAMQTLISSSPKESNSSHVATPGGITERGLAHIGELSSLFECAFAGMRTRAKELSV